MKEIFNNRPHEKVIESINAIDAPQVSSVAITRDEVIPFYSNFLEKIFIQKQMERSQDRAFQRILQFRHQNEQEIHKLLPITSDILAGSLVGFLVSIFLYNLRRNWRSCPR